MPTINQLVRHGRRAKIEDQGARDAQELEQPAPAPGADSGRPAEARRLPAGPDDDAQEAELGAAQDRARAPDQPDGGHGLHPGHRPQPPGALGRARPRRPGQGPARRSSTTSSAARSMPPASATASRVAASTAPRPRPPSAGGARCRAAPASPARPSTSSSPVNRTTARFHAKLMTERQAAAWPSASCARRSPAPRRPRAGPASRSSRQRCATRPRSSRSSRAASAARPTRSRSRSGAIAACRSACAGSSRPPASAAARA